MESNTSTMVILNGSNYYLWKVTMEDLLYVKDYYLPVFASEKPKNKTDAEWNLAHQQACDYIRQWVDDDILNYVRGEKHAGSLWNKLKQMYLQNACYNKVLLIKQLKRLKYQDGTPMVKHLNTFQGIINELDELDFKIDYEVQGLLLLFTFLDSWETFRLCLCNSAPDRVLTIDLVMNFVLDEEMRRKLRSSFPQSDHVVTGRSGRSNSRGPKNRYRSKSKTNKFVNTECYYCHLKGHIKKYCRRLKSDIKQGKVNDKKNDKWW